MHCSGYWSDAAESQVIHQPSSVAPQGVQKALLQLHTLHQSAVILQASQGASVTARCQSLDLVDPQHQMPLGHRSEPVVDR